MSKTLSRKSTNNNKLTNYKLNNIKVICFCILIIILLYYIIKYIEYITIYNNIPTIENFSFYTGKPLVSPTNNIIMKIFVLHYSKLVDRKKHILEQFDKQGIIDYEFIEKYDREDLQDCDMLLFDKCLKKSMISLINKHIYAYNIIASKNYECALILEDDVILCDNFIDKLNNYMTQLPENFDMLFIGDGCNLHIEKDKLIPNKNIYEKCLYPTSWGGDGASRCSDSYIISKKCANKFCKYINNLEDKIKLPSDWWLNVSARDNNFKVYWAEPTIVTQGTQNGTFQTSH